MVRKKVLYILHDVQIGGVEVALLSAVPDLNRKYDLRILALGKVSEKIISNLSKEEKQVFHSFNFKLYLYPFIIFRILKFILDFNPDVMISSLWRASLVGTIAKKLNSKIFFISFIHSSGFAHKLDRFFSTLAMHNADKVLVDSRATADFVRIHCPNRANINVISFCTTPSPIKKRNADLSLDSIRFLFLGRLHQVKNLDLTIETIRYLRSRGFNVYLDIYGKDDGEKEKLTASIQQLHLEEYIHLKGEIYSSEKLKIFSQYHFLIQLSKREGMAMSVAEAMQNGLVCVVTPVGEIPNYASDMQTAIFIDNSNKEQWQRSAEKIESVIQDHSKYTQISDACYDHFRDVKTYAQSLIEQLDAILEMPKHATPAY